MSLRKDISFFCGESIELDLQLKTPPTNPVDTWATIVEVYAYKTDTVPVWSGTPTLLDAALGYWVQQLTRAIVIANFPAFQYYYFWKRTNTGAEGVLAHGTFDVQWSGVNN